MIMKTSASRKIFTIINTVFLVLFAVVCLVPFINVLAVSFSRSGPATAGLVGLWPVEVTLKSYEYILHKVEFIKALGITAERVLLGWGLNMFLTIITAYPLSKTTRDFRHRTPIVWFFVFTMLFSGGLIPFYIIVNSFGMVNSIWALVIPGALPVFNMVLLLNFFRGLPKELEESAFIDGASHWKILWKIFVPLSIPALVTITLFTVVGHWNEWFYGMIFMSSPSKYPLQTYLQSLIVNSSKSIIMGGDAIKFKALMSERTLKSAQIFAGALPILLLYPFMQKYFMTGLVLGSVKE